MGRVRGVVKVDIIKAKGLKAYDTMGERRGVGWVGGWVSGWF
jgi:hypothetical protein